ncbi:MAG: aminopeptidase [Oscillospiraceae bacterium]
MNLTEKMEKYAQLVASVGINVQKGQKVVISCPVECAEFGRMVAAAAFDLGAKDVIFDYTDQKFEKIRFNSTPAEVCSVVDDFYAQKLNSLAKEGAAFVAIRSSDPDGLKGVEATKISQLIKSKKTKMKDFFLRQDTGELRWNIVAVPNEKWAEKVFPNVDTKKAMEMLWDAIFKAARVDENPKLAWENHTDTLKEKRGFLNKEQFDFVTLKNSFGTDVKIQLNKGHIWGGGETTSPDGTPFVPNMPTEEVFTTPNKYGVDGKIVSTKPLSFNGNLVDEFFIELKGGKITNYGAKVGEKVLASIIEADEGSHYLGELALVANNSPISNMNITFYNTLFDENASCHVAIGEGFADCIENGCRMTKAELLEKGINDSSMHVDFMIGSADMEIVGYKKDGTKVSIFKNGNWA